jgi:hypothetical protein
MGSSSKREKKRELLQPTLHRKSFDEEGHKCEKFPYKKETSVRL